MFTLVTGHQGNGGAGDSGGAGSDGDGADGAGIRAGRRARVLKITGLSLAGLLVLGAGAAGWVYWQLNDNITVTMPVLPAPWDRDRVVADEPEAGELWASLR